jgi:hypothetical protein
MEDLFNSALNQVFDCWTALNFAVETGSNLPLIIARQKQQTLKDMCVAFLKSTKTFDEDTTLVLSDLISEYCFNNFDLNLEDDSDLEVRPSFHFFLSPI